MASDTLEENIAFVDLAWSEAQSADRDIPDILPTSVYKSNVLISHLADTALKRWVSAFLLEN
jgi:hypothetical protein